MWCLAIELFECSINGVYSVIYRSPASNLNECIDFIDVFFEKTIKLNKLNVVTGDMNVNMNEPNTNTRALTYIFEKHGLNLIVNFNTRITNTSQTLIDYVLTNDKERVRCRSIGYENISDHETISIEIDKDTVNTASYDNVLSWSEYNQTDLIENLRNCDWSSFNWVDLDSKLEILRTNMSQSVANLIKEVKINKNSKPKKWFDTELIALKEK